MANTALIKRSSVQNKAPTTSDLSLGELAVNTYDGKLFLKKSVNGTESIVDLTNADKLDGQDGSYYTGYTDTAIANLIDSSPDALNTLNELSAALNDDASFSTTVTNSIATKMPIAGGQFTGDVTFNSGANAILLAANSDIRFANGSNWTGDITGKIQHYNNVLYISGGTGGIIFRESGTNRWRIDGDGHFIPNNGDGLLDIGTNSVRVRNGYFDNLYGDGSNLTNIPAAQLTGVLPALDGSNLTGVVASGTNANTLDNLDSTQFVRSDADDTLNGQYTISDNANEKLILSGSPNPYMRFQEGTTNKAYIQWSSAGYFQFVNTESGEILRIKDGNNGLTFTSNSTESKVFHAGNDGSGSNLDSDTLDGLHGSSYLKSDAADTCSGQITFTNQIISKQDGNRSTQGGCALVLTHNTTSALRANHFIHDDFPSGKGTYYIQVTESGVSNDRNMCLQGYGGKLGIGTINEPTATVDISGTFKVSSTSTFSGDATFSGGSGAITLAANSDITFGTSGSWSGEKVKLQHHGNTLYMQGGTNGINLRGSDGGTIAEFKDTSIRFYDPITITDEDIRSNGTSNWTGNLGNDFGKIQMHSNRWYIVANGNSNRLLQLRQDGTDKSWFANDGQLYHGSSNTNDKYWRQGNDGSGSTLDADLLDGVQASSFVRSDAEDTITAPLNINGGTANGSNDATLYVTASNNNDWGLKINNYNSSATEYGARIDVGSSANYALQITGNGSEVFRVTGAGTVYAGGNGVVFHTNNDGSGSNLDADKLDGVEAASFLRSDVVNAQAPQRIEFTANDTNNWDTIATASSHQGAIEVFNNGVGNDAFMAFHSGSDFAIYFGLDADSNKLAVGGWSMGANKYAIYHEGNKPSFSDIGITAANINGLGINATTLDSIDSTSFLRLDADNAVTSYQNRTRWPSSSSIGTASGHQASLEVYQGTAQSDAFMAFHVAGDYAGYFGLDGGDNQFKIGGWSLGAVAYKVWNESNDGSGSGLSADNVDGLDVHTGRNNEANKIVRTDGNGFIQAGWLNTPSGDTGTGSDCKFYASQDDYIRYIDLRSMRSVMNVSARSTAFSGREDQTTDQNYWIGSCGWGSNNFDTSVWDFGSCFFDVWSNPTGQPSGTSHWNGVQAMHYTNASSRYGMRITMGAGQPQLAYIQGRWNQTTYGWAKLWNALNDGSGSGLDSDTLRGWSGFPAGTLMLFHQTSAPTGWTKSTSHNNKALRIVSGSVGSGGSTTFADAFNANRVTSGGSVSNHTLSTAQMPSHTHTGKTTNHDTNSANSQGYPAGNNHQSHRTSDRGRTHNMVSASHANTGSSNSHSHGFSNPSFNLNVQYVDVIIASKA